MAEFDIKMFNADTVAPHLAPLRHILTLNFRRQSCLQGAYGAIQTFARMKLKPEHHDEAIAAIQAVSDLIRARREKHGPAIVGWLTTARKALEERRPEPEKVPNDEYRSATAIPGQCDADAFARGPAWTPSHATGSDGGAT